MFIAITCFAVVFAAISFYRFLDSHNLSRSERDRINYGMTKQQLERAVGKPHRIEPGGIWYYNSFGIIEGRVLVEFDDDDKVCEIIL